MEITREQIELLQKHEVDEHTILEIIKDILGNQSLKLSQMNAKVPSTMVGAGQQKTIKPRKKRATKAEMEARKQTIQEKHADVGRNAEPVPDDFDQSAVDAALANTKRHLAKSGKQTSFDPPTF